MKKITLVLALSFGILKGLGQCIAPASGFGNNTNTPSYNISGDVSITYQNGQITFKTDSNFSTASGPDVRVYLANSEGRTDQQLISTHINNIPNIPFGLVSFSGQQEITVDVPEGVDLSNYDTVYFFCFQFSAFWDFGKITPFNSSNCNSLSLSKLEKINTLKVYPNPVESELFVEGDLNELTEYKIYNSLGSVVRQSENIQNTIDVQTLSSGIYSLIFYSETTFQVTKIIKR